MDQVNPKGSSSLLVTGGSYIFNKNEKVIVILNLDFTTDAWIIRSFSSLSLEKFANSPIRQFANSPIRQFAQKRPQKSKLLRPLFTDILQKLLSANYNFIFVSTRSNTSSFKFYSVAGNSSIFQFALQTTGTN